MEKFTVRVNGKEVYFGTEDSYSYNWFYPRYRDNGLHERKVTELILENCKRAKSFVDIGAHIGFFSCVVAKTFPKIDVHSFEMERQVFELLQKNVELNKTENIKLYNYAISDSKKTVYYEKSQQPNEKTSLCKKNDKSVSTKSIALDDLGFVPDVVKIDVEGTELDVLKGMSKVLSRVKAVFIEIHPELYKRNEAEKILEFLKDFRVYEICDHRRRSDPDIIKADPEYFVYNNMLYAFSY